MFELSQVVQGGQLTISSGAWLLARHEKKSWKFPEEYAMVKDTIEGALSQILHLPCIPEIDASKRRDTRSPGITMAMKDSTDSSPLKVFTDYEDAQIQIPKSGLFQLVETPEEADFLLVLKQITNFMQMSPRQFVAQFPYEGGIVRKDLLPLTIRRCCYQGEKPPSWWLPCFDLSTEFHLLFQEYKRRELTGEPNWWILKPPQAARGKGHKVFFSDSSEDKDLLGDMAENSCPFDDDKSCDKVAQLLVQNPLLALGRKFDLRLFVVVRSFCPFEAYVHNVFYARLANKEYRKDQLSDSEVAITINAYDADETIAAKQERLILEELRDVLLHEVWGLTRDDASTDRYQQGLKWWKETVDAVFQALRELFRGVATSIGSWPLSRAYYAVDMILDNTGAVEKVLAADVGDDMSLVTRDPYKPTDEVSNECIPPVPEPKLMEVNYMGDWHGMSGSFRTEDSLLKLVDVVPKTFLGSYLYDDWCQDILLALLTNRDLDPEIFTSL